MSPVSPEFPKFLRIGTCLFHFLVKGVERFQVILLHDIEEPAIDGRLDLAVHVEIFGFLDEQLLVDQTRDELALLFRDGFFRVLAFLALLNLRIDDIFHFTLDTR